MKSPIIILNGCVIPAKAGISSIEYYTLMRFLVSAKASQGMTGKIEDLNHNSRKIKHFELERKS
jgi:hypothetical protein